MYVSSLSPYNGLQASVHSQDTWLGWKNLKSLFHQIVWAGILMSCSPHILTMYPGRWKTKKNNPVTLRWGQVSRNRQLSEIGPGIQTLLLAWVPDHISD